MRFTYVFDQLQFPLYHLIPGVDFFLAVLLCIDVVRYLLRASYSRYLSVTFPFEFQCLSFQNHRVLQSVQQNGEKPVYTI